MVKWNLSHLEISEEELDKKVESFTAYKGKLNKETFLKALPEFEEIDIMVCKLIAKSQLWLSENTADSARNSNAATISQYAAEISNKIIFFTHWFKSLENADEIINESGKYKYTLLQLRKLKPFMLSEDEERIVNLKDLSGAYALSRLYDVITNKYTFEWKGKNITSGEMNVYKQSPNREERAASYQKVFSRYEEDKEELSEIYKAIIRDWKNENIKIRGYGSPISVRNLSNDIEDEVIEVLLDVIKTNVHMFREYFKLKYKEMGLKDRYDLYAPYEEKTREYSYEESKKIVLDTYKEFDEEMYCAAKEIFDADHIHSEIIPNKRSGAFQYAMAKDLVPYIMLNHSGSIRDVFTMMHECGHGIHSILSKDHTQFTYHAALPLAETASIFGEMILSQKMLSQAKKPVLLRMLDNQYASIIRQGYFVMFEKFAHDNPSLTQEEYSKKYMEMLKEQFDMEIPTEFQYEWLYIPHIYHSPFYCYAYSFGNLLVLALYAEYKKHGTSFVPKIKEILKAGGSDTPRNILRKAGFDITSKEFWQGGFNIIAEEIEQLRKALKDE